MMLRTVDLSSSQKELVGPELQDRESILFSGGHLKMATLAERQNAAVQMRYQLYLLDRSQHRMSIEELAADLLEHPGAEFPA